MTAITSPEPSSGVMAVVSRGRTLVAERPSAAATSAAAASKPARAYTTETVALATASMGAESVNPAAMSTSAVELAMPGRLAALATSTRTALRLTGALVGTSVLLAEVDVSTGAAEVEVVAEAPRTVVVEAVAVGAAMVVWSTDVGRPAMATPAIAPSRTVMTTATHERFMIRKQ